MESEYVLISNLLVLYMAVSGDHIELLRLYQQSDRQVGNAPGSMDT